MWGRITSLVYSNVEALQTKCDADSSLAAITYISMSCFPTKSFLKPYLAIFSGCMPLACYIPYTALNYLEENKFSLYVLSVLNSLVVLLFILTMFQVKGSSILDKTLLMPSCKYTWNVFLFRTTNGVLLQNYHFHSNCVLLFPWGEMFYYHFKQMCGKQLPISAFKKWRKYSVLFLVTGHTLLSQFIPSSLKNINVLLFVLNPSCGTNKRD